MKSSGPCLYNLRIYERAEKKKKKKENGNIRICFVFSYQ